MSARPRLPARGFTLIEIIISLALLGLVAGMVVSFYNSGAFTTSEPVTNLQRATDLSKKMADLVTRFNAMAVDPAYSGNNSVLLSPDFQTYVASKDGVDFNVVGNNETSVTVQNASLPALQVTIQDRNNTGEMLTYYFPLENLSPSRWMRTSLLRGKSTTRASAHGPAGRPPSKKAFRYALTPATTASCSLTTLAIMSWSRASTTSRSNTCTLSIPT